MRIQNLVGIIFCCAMLGTGCSERDAGPGTSDTYVQLGISDIDSLDPAWAYDTASHAVIANIYENLVAFKGSSQTELEPRVSEQIPSRDNGLISADGRTYTFPIRKGLRFHDGQELTPEDVRYSLMRFMLYDRDGGPSPLLLEPMVGYANTREKGQVSDKVYDDVDRAVRVEGGRVTLHLHRPFAPLLTVLANWAPVLPKAWCAANGEWDGSKESWQRHNNPEKETSHLYNRANGSGPFMLERWDTRNKEIVLKRFDGYWRGPAKLARTVLKGVDEFATRKLMLQAGDADSIYADRLQFPLLQGIPGVDIIDDLPIIDMNPTVFFTFRVETAGNPNIGSGKLDGDGIPADFFSDLHARLGFAHAFDYDGFIRDIDRGKGERATGFIPKGLLGYRKDIPGYPYDLKKAQAHLRKAHGGKLWEKGFKFTIAYNAGNQAREAIANMLKRAVESLNPKFKVDTRAIQWSTYLDQMDHSKLPLFILGWNADYPDPHNFAFTYMHSQGRYPLLQGYRDPQADALVNAAVSELSDKKREELYVRLQGMAFEQAPHFNVRHTLRYRTQRAWVKGFTHNPVWPEAPYSCPLYALEKTPG